MASPFKKLVAVGDADCGKTALFQVYLKNKYLDEETPITVGNEIVNINVDGKTVEVSLWCTSGEKFEGLARLCDDHVRSKCTCLHHSLQVRRNMTHSAHCRIIMLMLFLCVSLSTVRPQWKTLRKYGCQKYSVIAQKVSQSLLTCFVVGFYVCKKVS